MKLRTALITSQYPPQLGGVGHSAARVARLLHGAGLEVHVVAFEKRATAVPFDESIATTEEDGITVHRVAVLHPPTPPGACEAATLTRYNREMVQALDHLQQRHRFDVLHGFFLYPAGYVAALVGRLHGVPVIASIRGNDVGKYGLDPHRLPFVRVALENADLVTSVATDLIRFADGGIARIAHKARTILNSVATPKQNGGPRPELALRGMVVGSAGLFRYKKGLVYLFKALASLNGGLDYSVLLAGDWFHDEDRDTHQRLLDDYGLTARTVVTGRIVPERMADYLALFDVLVFPSLFSEGCPLSMLEAMAMGKTVIASRVAAIPEIVRHGENGWLVSPGSSAEIASAIQTLAADPALRRRLGEAAARTAADLDHEREAAAWLDAYRAIRGVADLRIEPAEVAAWARVHLDQWLADSTGGACRVESAMVDPLRDVPGRRWTARCRLALRATGGPTSAVFVIKGFARAKNARRLARHLRTVNLSPEGRDPRWRRVSRTPDPPLRFPRLIAFDERRAIVATEFLPGHNLEQALPDIDLGPVMRAAGGLLARFHRGHADARKRVTPRRELYQLAATGRRVREAFPQLATPLRRLGSALRQHGVGQRRGRPALLHGSFRLNHLLVDGPSLAVVDLESLRSGPAAYDLGNWIASLYYLETEGRLGREMRRHIVRDFLEGYEAAGTRAATPLEVAWYASDLLAQKQALKYATRFREDRAARAARMIELAEEVLATAPRRRAGTDLCGLWKTLP